MCIRDRCGRRLGRFAGKGRARVEDFYGFTRMRRHVQRAGRIARLQERTGARIAQHVLNNLEPDVRHGGTTSNGTGIALIDPEQRHHLAVGVDRVSFALIAHYVSVLARAIHWDYLAEREVVEVDVICELQRARIDLATFHLGHVHLRNIQNFLLLEELLYRIVRKRNADKDDREKEGESDRKDRFRVIGKKVCPF